MESQGRWAEQRSEQRSERREQHVQQRSEQHFTQTLTQQVESTVGALPITTGRPGDPSPPIFEQIFKNARFAQGGNAKFEGKLRGNPTPTVSWTRKKAPLVECSKYSMSYSERTGDVALLIKQIGPGDEGEYTCTARNQYGEAICSVYIQPEGAPQPAQASQQSYRHVSESVEHKSYGTQGFTSEQTRQSQKYAYTNGNSDFASTEHFKVDTFEYRLLREVSFRETITKRYVGETDIQINTEIDTSLGPVSPPKISQKPRNSKLQEGADAQFQVQLSGNPRPRVTWFKNGQRIVNSNKHNIITSNNQTILRIRSTQTSDCGHYTLLAENPNGCIVTSAYLAVETPQEPYVQDQRSQLIIDTQQVQTEKIEIEEKALAPQFVKACQDRDVTEGKMTRFDCRVTGRPYPEVTWFINDRQIRDDYNHKILVNESGNHALMITNVDLSDSGVVTCVARNKSGEASFQCRLNVIEKEQVVAPKFVERFSTLNVREGEPVQLNARALGTPTPRITWQKDGVPIVPNAELRIHTEGGASTLDIPKAKASDAAWYQCTAQNVAGSTATRARLYVEVPKEPPPEQKRLHLPRPTKIIEPEPAPGPEIIYLRHVERARPFVPPGEEDRVYPPPQFIVPLKSVTQMEGGKIHFETRIEPVGDPSMRIEWLKNGQSIKASSRFTSVFRFGYISLDMLSLNFEDSGEYTCRAISATGMAETKAVLQVTPRATIERTSQHPQSLQYIQQLEDYSKYQHQESVEEHTSQKPQFIRPLQDLGELQEGRNAHFEGQLTPVSDPTMRVEWYKDGKPITASSRITAIFNFGYVSLNIMHLRAEDAGSYTVRAVNRLGEAISSATIRVAARSTVTSDLGIPEQRRYIEKTEQLEAYQQQQHQKYYQEAPESTQRPEFKTPIKDQINVKEGGFAHFEARLEPVGDSTLKVEWLKDGRPVEASSRITTFFNFGYVALTIKSVTIHDAGHYTCRAYNALGQATTSANLSIITKKDIIAESQHPGGLERIQYLEDSSKYSKRAEEEVRITQKPRFLGPLKGTNKIVEGQSAHFEARVEPQSDLTLTTEWYFNGKQIKSANRIQTYHDFGYVALDISNVRAEDSGVYTVVVRNAAGEAQQNASMVVETRSSIDTSSIHHGLYEKTRQMEESKFIEPMYHIEEISKSKPIFVQPLSDPPSVSEGKNIHLECRLEPMGDPTMRVEWFHNGRAVTVGSRFRTYYDFGFVALDIIHATSVDSGEYTARAVNHLGSAHTSAMVRVIERSDIVTDTQNEQAVEQIQILEDAARRTRQVQEDITVMRAPHFSRALHNIETVEGTNVHLECRLQPVGDPTMKVDWFCNGRPIKTGHRFRPAYEFDYVALDLLSVYPEDSGVYTCQATNQLGEAVTSCALRVMAKKDLIFDTQHPTGLEKIQYLEDASRYKKSDVIDESIHIKPRFITKPKSIDNVKEGHHVHFECKLEPVTDSNLKVEWFKNGQPVTIGHRFRPIHDFGYVALDIIDLIAEDSGVYTCRAVNQLGTDEVSCRLSCRETADIIRATQNEAGLEQIQVLEDRSKYHRTSALEEVTTQAPIFTTSLKNVEIKEGQRAHFECRLIPVSDATMKVEWYHNNKPLKSGSRFTETNNFGFVALDIMSCLPEDSGTYTCRAINALGEAVTSGAAVVHSKKSIYLESQHEGALPRLTQLEDSSRHQRHVVQDESVTQAPLFTNPMKDLRVAENQAAHFETRLIPVGDPKLKVEWLRNGVPIEASNRITTMHDFGYVALNMKYVNPADSGTYTCRATNELGEAVTSSTLFVQSKASLDLQSQHEAALQKIQQLEDTSRYQRKVDEEVAVNQAPRFITQLNGPSRLMEGQSAHYECRIEPYPDPNMRVEWYFNGKVLQSGHRYRTAFDFGFAALDILTVYGEDSGEYTCKVINNLGQAISNIKLNVQSKESIIRDTQHESALEKIQYLEDDSRNKRVVRDEGFVAEKPQFGKPLKNAHVAEGLPVHLEATLTPVNDPTMRVEWYCNGRPIQQGHRFKTTYDFGYVALDVLYAYSEDSGTYMCKATNAVGEAVTTSSVNVDAKASLYLDTLDEQRLRKIKELEQYERPKAAEQEAPGQRPVFLTALTSLENLKEGDRAHFECRVEPINDPDLKIEWFLNGQKIKTGHRFRTTHDFGYVALDILYSYAEDSGTYMCKATNKLGEAVNTCTLKVASHRSIILDTQHPNGLEKIKQLEAQGHSARMEIEEPKISPPRFVTELRGTTHVYEGQTAHFECQVEPVHDPNLRIEFYHNGVALQSASRFHITFDFGYVSLDIQHCVPEDAGEYSVKAINALGQCTSAISMTVTAKGSIISESQRPQGLEKIRELESAEPFKRPEIPEPVTRQRPVFTQPLQNIDNIQEGQTAHFDCRLIPVGDPTLKVEWYRNEKLIEDSSRITKTHDFGYVSMSIAHVRDEDEGVYMCRASNLLGEAVTTAAMRIKTKAAIQMETQHPEGMRKIQQLEQPQQRKADQPEREFEKPIFTQVLTGPSELWEGQHAHYEARVVPVGDPSLRFEWYINGVELKMGSRFRTTHDFGFVTLDINSVVQNDAGLYMCKAINKAGSTVSSTSLKVKTKTNIIDEAMRPEAWQQIQLKEAAMNKVPEMFMEPGVQQAPIFTTHLQSYDKLVEGQHVHLEAQVEPRTDPNLRVEWFKNGVSLTTGARLKSTFDFGLVTLSINSVRFDDSGIYTCKATNLIGEAVSTSSIKIEDRHWLLGDTLHPESLDRIGALEQPKPGKPDAPEPVYETPVFISHLNNIICKEGDNIHFECNVEPSRDPTLKIEWFFNNKALPSGTRYKSTHDFSYVSLDMTHTYEEDSGIYTCKATNSKGSATTSGTLRCTGDKHIYLDTQHPQGKAGLDAVEQAEEARLAKGRRTSVPDAEYPKPEWIVPVAPEHQLIEGQALHLEGQVEPKNDPDLKIEWYFNGKVLEQGSRFKIRSDFGFVTLDLTDVYERDSGIYTCKAWNKRGEAFTSSTVYCSSKENLIERTQHPKGKEGLEKIQNLEESLRREPGQKPDDDTGRAPEFVTVFEDITEISEGQIAHYEATLIPTGDQSMVIEWFYNGKTIEASHRIRTVYAFGMVVLEILGTKTSDSGTYSCRATNKWGQAEISVKLGCVDKSKGQKPRFTTHIQNIEGLKDGQSAHFECTVVPVDDPDMKIEWYHNGQPMRHSTRIKTISDFGFVVLDIAYTQNHDTGEYVCRAYNKYGEDFTKATISCYGRGGVYSDSLQPDSLAKIRELESLQGMQKQAPAPASAEPPRFITQIEDVTKLVEGQSAHFEARLVPVDDPDLKVEWYYNGKKLPHGHRYRTFHDFGIVILDILYCYEENSGEYECVATNKLGRDSTKAMLKCTSKENLILDSQLPRGMEGGLEKLQTLEDSMIRRKDTDIEEKRGKAPVFTVPLSNIDNLREGENAHFEARLTPTDDPQLKVEWYWNGKSLKAGSRFRTFCDFGFVILEISPTYPEDSGEYLCKAYNNYGEAVTTATMKVQGKRNIILESQLPKGMEGTIDKIAALEGYTGTADNLSPEAESGNPPEFITTPSDLILSENSSAHFECRLVPVNDSSMTVEWYHNGKPLLTGSRVKTINDFGFVILEIGGVYQRDAGLYTCKATNKHGEATVSCKLQVKGRQGIILEPQLPSQFKTGTESIQKLEETLHKREEITIEDEKPNPPRFTVEIKDNVDVAEGGPVHFDCRVEPVGDPTMRIDWFCNGRPFATGSRVHMLNDFGFIALDIDYVYTRDAGEYTCRATNRWGSATTTAKVTCSTKRDVVLDSQLPHGMSGEKIKELERGHMREAPKEEPVISSPPKFITQIQSHTIEESESIRFECRVEPKEDPKLRVEWYRNGKLLPSGHRFRTVYDMGFVSLDILYVYAEDSGEYVCRAVNDFGEDFTKATVSCKQLPDIILQNQVPKGMKKSEALTQMEATIKKYTSEVFLTEEDLYDVDKKQPPRFVTQIQSQTTLVEMESTKFECQLAPVGDPNMKVEWFFNGKPLLHKNRFTPIYDFGYVAMNFGWVYPEDSGEYLCRATNLYGQDETRAVIQTAGKPGIVYESQLPKHMKSIERIREMEASWQVAPEQAVEETKPRSAPVFVSKPEPCNVPEGEWARFCCRVTGHPKPRVMWLINGNTIVNGSRYKLTYDGMYHLDIPKTRQYDTGKIEVIARSSAGEALATTELRVVPRHDDYRGVLKNAPRRVIGTTDYRKPEWVTHMENLQEALKVSHFVPTFVKPLMSQRARVEQTAIFTARYCGVPKPEIIWYKDGEVVRTDETYTIEDDGETTVCKITNVTKKSEGTYRCEAVSDVGKASTTAVLRVFETKETVDKVSAKKTKVIKKDQRREVIEELSITAMEEIPKEVIEQETSVKKSKEDRAEPELVEEETVDIVTTKILKTKKDQKKEKVKEVIEDISVSAPEEIVPQVVIKEKAPIEEFPVEEKKIDKVEPELVDQETAEKATTKKTRIIKKDQRKQTFVEDVLISATKEVILPKDEEGPVEDVHIDDHRLEPVLVEDEMVDTFTTKKTKVKKDLRREKVKEVLKDVSISTVEEAVVPQEVSVIKAPVQENKIDRVVPELVEEETTHITKTKKTKVKKDLRKASVEDELTATTEEITKEKPLIEENKADNLEAAPIDQTTEIFENIPYQKQKATKAVEEDSRMVAEINELLEVIDVKQFGPGESPLRELAKIGYMLRNGVSTEQIESLYDAQLFPALRAPQAQSALVRLVERQGYSALITEALTEDTTQSEDVIAAKVGFRAFMRMIAFKHVTVEEVITHFCPEDFKPRSWEHKEASEIEVRPSDDQLAKKSAVEVLKDTAIEPEERKLVEDSLHGTEGVKAPKHEVKSFEDVQQSDIKSKSKKPLKLLKMEQVSIKFNEAQFPKEMEQPQFSKIKLKKSDIKPKKEQSSSVLPKVQLKSRIKFVTDWPPNEVKPIISFLKSVRQNGELSRNIKEATKLKKKKVLIPEIPEAARTQLEKPELGDFIKEDTKQKSMQYATSDHSKKEFPDEEFVKDSNNLEHQPSEISLPDSANKRKTKLKPMTIEEKVIEPNLPQFAESIEEPQFKKIHLKKGVIKTRSESSAVKIPKIQLKSRIKFVGDWPPEIIKPNVSFLGGVRQNGILSRNIKEAVKIKKTVLKQPVLPEIEKTELEKPMFTQKDILGTKSTPEKDTEKLPIVEDIIQDEPEQFTITSRRPSAQKIEEIIDEVTIKKKLKPVRKSSITLPEITEPEEVTFRPKITKTKEEVEQEFNIHLDSYEEEEISMSSKVKLKPQRQPTFKEEENEVSIKVYEEKEGDEDNIIEIIESDGEKEESANIIMPLKKPAKPMNYVEDEITSSVIISKPKSPLTESTEFTEDVTFELGNKTKHDIDDLEISFDLKKQKDEFKSEELSLSTKIKLARKKKLTIDEAGDETSIKLEQEIEDDGQAEEIIMTESESEERVEMVLKRKPKKPTYEVSEVEELSVEFKPKKIDIDAFEEERLTISAKRVPRKPSLIQEAEASMSIAREQEFPASPADVRQGDTVFAVYSYMAETDEAINLVEGERLYILDTTNQDWWFVRKHLTEEKGWVPAQYLMDETNYTLYLQKKLNEKIDKLPVFEKPTSEERAIAPIFVEKLRPKHIPDGSTVQFECQVEGYPRPQITWFRQTAIIKPSQDFQMYYDDDNVATLVIREVFPEDAGTFTCVAKNAAGFASSTAELTVDAPLSDHGSELAPLSRKSLSRESSLADILEGIPPTFSKRPKAQYVDEGSQIFLECRLVAIPEPDIAWFFKGEEVIPDDNVSVAIESDMHMYCSVLKISNVKKFQEGTYTVLAVNREGEANLPIVLKIKTGENEKPQVIEPLKSMTIREGESVVLTTQVVGSPEPKVVWYKNNKPIKEPIQKTDGNVHSITIIKPKKGKDDGVYSLKAYNSEGNAETSAVITIEEPTEEDAEPPLFINRFQELTVKEKGIIRLNAKVTGNPVPSITWYRNNQILTPNATVTQTFDGENIELVITDVDSEIDSGDYKCVASNSAGKASHGARVTIDVDKVVFVRHLKKLYETEEGKTVVLECETSHTVSTKWYHNDKELSGMDHREIIQESRLHKLRIKRCKLTDQGSIKCIVKDQETTTSLIVNETIPEFVRKLQDFEVKERDIAILEVEINSETADVTWEKDGKIIKPKKNKYEIEKRGNIRKLFIRNTSVHDEGEYACKLRDDECSAEVTVVELPPEIITRLRDQKVSRGNRATFEIELTKGDALVRWFKDGSEIQFSNRIQLTIDGKKQKLKIYDCEESDQGVYACEVGNDKCAARLTVEEPSIDFTLRLPEVIVVPVNTDAYLTVEVPDESNKVTWFRRKTAIEDSEKFNLISDARRRVFVIRKCTEEDQCEYSCQLEETKCTTRLKVEVGGTAPVIVDCEKIYRVRRGADVTLTVRYTGRTAREQWRRGGEPLPRSKRRKPSSEAGSASLTLRRTEQADAGVYTLRLDNEFGEAQVDLEVVVMDVPSPPGKPSVLEVLDSTVHVCWSEPANDGYSPIQCYILEYQEIDTAEWMAIENIKSLQRRVENLHSSSSYRFRAFAVNEVGVGESSDITEFILIEDTIKEGPPTVEKALRDTVASPDDLIELTCIFGGVPVPTVTWTRNGSPLPRTAANYRDRVAALSLTAADTVEGEYRCVATNRHGRVDTSCTIRVQQKPTVTIINEEKIKRVYVTGERWSATVRVTGVPRPDVRWRRDGGDVDEQRVAVTTGEEVTEATITDVRRSDAGKYSVEAANAAGAASVDIPLAVFEVPSAPRGPLGLYGSTASAVTLAWQAPDSDGGCPVLDYSVEALVGGGWRLVATALRTEVRVDKLDARIKYRFRICARNRMGVGAPFAPEQDFTLGDGPTRPAAPRRFGTGGVTSRSVLLQWEPPEFDGGSPLTNYIVECREVQAPEAEAVDTWRKVVTVQASTLQHRVENIRARRLLEFRVSAENAVGVGLPATCEPVRLVTHATVPSPPTGPLELRALGGAVAAAAWGAPEWDGGAPLLGYTVAVRDMRKTMWMQVGEVDAATLRFQIRDLTEDRAYAIRIYAVNEVGASEPLESQEPFEVVPGEDSARSEGPGEATEATEPTSFSTQTTSWLRDHNMDADIRSYARGSLLRRDEYFFRIWHYARRLFE